MALGAVKYGDYNWGKANSKKEFLRFHESGMRHFMQWRAGETDEDHMAAVAFNLAAAEYVRRKLGLSDAEVAELIEKGVDDADTGGH